MDRIVDENTANYLNSTLRERIVEHLFVGEALRWLWNHRVTDVEILRSEFDAGGYDLVMSYKKIVRHIQLKSSLENGKAANIKASLKLMEKPSGCIIWIFVTKDLEIVNYRWFGGDPYERLPDLGIKVAKHTKGNANGIKTERPQHRIIPKGRFDPPCSINKIMELLFGELT
jgi:hypothetical protein